MYIYLKKKCYNKKGEFMKIIILLLFFSFSFGEKYLVLYSNKDENMRKIIEPFEKWKKQIGYEIELIPISQIPIIKNKEEKRDYLIAKDVREFLKTKPAKYLLIIGSTNTIPVCYTTPIVDVPKDKPGVIKQTIPTDYYYADLTGNWNEDNNEYYGEYVNKNKKQEPENFEAELYVGRIPCDDSTTVEQILQRTILWEQNTRKKNALLAGAIFEYKDSNYISQPQIDAAYFCEKIKKEILCGYKTFSLYETVGINPSQYSSNRSLSISSLITEWNKGYDLVYLGGHGSQEAIFRTKWMVDDGDDIPQDLELNSSAFVIDAQEFLGIKPSVVFTDACSVGSFNDGSFGIKILKNQAVSFIGSSVLAYSVSKDNWKREDGGINTILYDTYKYLIQENLSIGESLYKAKFEYSKLDWSKMFDDFLGEMPVVNQMNMMSINLFGDPSLKLEPQILQTDIFSPYIEVKVSPLNYTGIVTSLKSTFEIYFTDIGSSDIKIDSLKIKLNNKEINSLLEKKDKFWYTKIVTENSIGENILTVNVSDNKENNKNFNFQFYVDPNVKLSVPEYSVYNYPNPFENSTTICFKTNKPVFATLYIYNVAGELIYSTQKELETEGKIEWLGTNNRGNKVCSGIYIYQLVIKDKYSNKVKRISKKICLIR